MADEGHGVFFAFDLGEYGQAFRFETTDQLTAWCNKELQNWEWVRQVNAGRAFAGLYEHVTRGPTQIRPILASGQAKPAEMVQGLEQAFQSNYCSGKSIHSTHPKSGAILKLEESDPVAAVAMLAVTSGFQGSPSRPIDTPFTPFSSVVRGFIENALFENELKGAAESQAEALSKLKQEFKDQVHQQADLLKSFEALIEGSKATSEKAVADQTKKLEALHGVSTNQFGELIKSAKADLEGYIESVKKRWALSESVSFWETKERYHKKRAFWFGIIWPSLGVTLASAVFCLAWWLSGGLKGAGSQVNQAPAGQVASIISQPNYWHIAVLLIAVTISLWFLRILVRVFLSHMHRRADAHERVTLIKTYLALLQEGKELVPDDRKIIIQTIFRPSMSGIVKEDAAPASPWEFLSRK